MRLSIICALDRVGSFGVSNTKDLPWSFREELKWFREVTMGHSDTSGHPVVMGRNTWESLPPAHRPLKGRPNFVVTSKTADELPLPPGVGRLTSLTDLDTTYPGETLVFVIGGIALIKEALASPVLSSVYLTLIDGDFSDTADVALPGLLTLLTSTTKTIVHQDVLTNRHDGKAYSVTMYRICV